MDNIAVTLSTDWSSLLRRQVQSVTTTTASTLTSVVTSSANGAATSDSVSTTVPTSLIPSSSMMDSSFVSSSMADSSTTRPSTAVSSMVHASTTTSLIVGSLTASLSGAVAQPTTKMSSTTPTSTSASQNQKSNRLSNGAVAGVAVGVTVLGIIIGLGVAFVLMAKRKDRRIKPSTPASKGQQTNGINKPDYDALLPQPIDISSLRHETQRLFDTVDGHVQNYYHNKPIGAQLINHHDVSFSSTGMSEQKGLDIQKLLMSSQTRPSAIIAIIISTLLDSIDPFGPPSSSLLPSIVPSFLHGLGKPKWQSHAQSLCISRWRTSTAFLLRDHASADTGSDIRNASTEIVQRLSATLAPFVESQKKATHDVALRGLCKRSEALGMILLSQPVAWEFIWSFRKDNEINNVRTAPSLVVLPGLRPATDSTGLILPKPQLVLEPHVRRLV